MKTFYAHEPHVAGTTLYNPGDKREADENDVGHLLKLGVLGDKPPKATAAPMAIDYDRDGLKDLSLTAANKDQLLVIAAYEQAEASGDATKAALIKAIEAKRSAA